MSRYSSDRQRNSSRSSYGGSISDIESDQVEKYRSRAKSLAREKAELKDKLRTVLDEVERKNRDHRVELEKIQLYFQKEFSEERDNLNRQIEILSQRVKAAEKKTAGKEQQVIKRLENTIVTLQERLNTYNEEKQIHTQRDEKSQQQVTRMEEENKKLREEAVKQINLLQTQLRVQSDEKQQLIYKIRGEKDQEFERIYNEKNGKISALQSNLEHALRKISEGDALRLDEINKARSETMVVKSDYERKFNEFMSSGKRSLEDLRQEYENKITGIEQRHRKELELVKKENEKALDIARADKERSVELSISNLQRELEEQRKANSGLQKEISSHSERSGTHLNKKDEEVKRLYLELQKKDKELNAIQLQSDKVKGESEDTICKLRDQLTQVRDNTKRLQDHAQLLNNQFMANLNRQKELADKEIMSRDHMIFQLEQQLKKVGEETIDRFNLLDRTLKNTQDDLRIANEKQLQAVSASEKQEQRVEEVKAELQKAKAEKEQLVEAFHKYQLEKELSEKRLKIDVDMKEQQTQSLRRSHEEYKGLYERLRVHHEELQTKSQEQERQLGSQENLLVKAKQDNESLIRRAEDTKNRLEYLQGNYQKMELRLSQQVAIVSESERCITDQRGKLEIANRLCEDLKTRLREGQEAVRKLETTLNEKETELLAKGKALTEAQRTNEEAAFRLREMTAEIVRVKKAHGEEEKKRIVELELEKEKGLAELAKKLSGAEAVIANQEIQRRQLERNLSVVTAEKQKMKASSDALQEKERQLADLQKRFMSLEALLVDIEKAKQDALKKGEITNERCSHLTELIAEKEKAIKEGTNRLSVLEQTVQNHEQLKQQMEKNLQMVTEKYTKAIEAPDSELKNKTRDIQRLQEELYHVNEKYANLVNGLRQELKAKEDELTGVRQMANELPNREQKIQELTERIGTIQQEYRGILDRTLAESKRDKEELAKWKSREAVFDQQSNELARLKETLETVKSTYDKLNTRLIEEKKSEIASAQQKVSEANEAVRQTEEKMEKLRSECIHQIAEARRMPKQDSDKLQRYEVENLRLAEQVEAQDKRIVAMQVEMAQTIANTNARGVFWQQKEAEVKKLEEEVKNAPPKLLDPSLRRERDEALATLRQTRMELNITKDESTQLSEKVSKAETTIGAMELEKKGLLKAQEELQRTLTITQKRYERDIGQKEQRIRELEGVISAAS